MDETLQSLKRRWDVTKDSYKLTPEQERLIVGPFRISTSIHNDKVHIDRYCIYNEISLGKGNICEITTAGYSSEEVAAYAAFVTDACNHYWEFLQDKNNLLTKLTT